MAVTEVTTVSAECDLCHEGIDVENTYVDAMPYGAAFHIQCLQEGSGFSPLQVMKALGLDDIHLMTKGTRVKLIYNFS